MHCAAAVIKDENSGTWCRKECRKQCHIIACAVEEGVGTLDELNKSSKQLLLQCKVKV